MRRWIAYVLIGLVVVAAAVYAAFTLSPWPSVLLIRYAFEKDAAERNRALEKQVPGNVSELRDQRYGESADALLDVFFPSDAGTSGRILPTIVWIHGGGFISGTKEHVAPYLKILAGRDYTTVGLDYSVAPGARYPTPVIQANEALSFLTENSARYHIDTTRLFLAGDSAGSQIAAQLAATISDPAYAATVGIAPAIERTQLKGVVLFCGVYDASGINLGGDFAGFIRTVMWAYFGTKDFADDPRLAEFSVARHLTPEFPPAFVSVGNADPLAPQSVAIAEALRSQDVPVDTLFYPADYRPPLPHEYQFNLDEDAGREALQRLSSFLAGLAS